MSHPLQSENQTFSYENYFKLFQHFSHNSACHLKEGDAKKLMDFLRLSKDLYGQYPLPWNNSAFPGVLPAPSFPVLPPPSTSSPHYEEDRSCSPPLNLSMSNSCRSSSHTSSPAPSETSSEPEMPLSLISNTKSSRKYKRPANEDEWNKRLEERRKVNAARERVRNKNMRGAYSRLRSALHLPSSAKHITTLFTALETLSKCTCRSVSDEGCLKTPPMDQTAYLARLSLLMKQAQEQSQHSTRAASRRLPLQGPDEEVEKDRRFANAARERKRVKELVIVIRELGRICQAYFDQKGTLGPRTYLDILMMTASIVDACTCKGMPDNSAPSGSSSPARLEHSEDTSSQRSRSPFSEQDENKMALELDQDDLDEGISEDES